MNLSDMTNLDLTDYLVNSADVPQEHRYSYNAGYFEAIVLTLMDRYPAVREEIEQRVRFRMGERGELPTSNVIQGKFGA
jgi:hypothetical protein